MGDRLLTNYRVTSISLRTSSANDRYNEGRRAWSAIALASRNFGVNIWLHGPPTTLSSQELALLPPERLEVEKCKGLIEKRTMLNLVQAFSVATKHYLRGEGGVVRLLSFSFPDERSRQHAAVPRRSISPMRLVGCNGPPVG